MANHLKREKQLAVLAALVEGNSIRSTERLTGVHRDTILRLLVRVGRGCRGLLDGLMRDLALTSVQCDEIWTYVAKKEKHATPAEKLTGAAGDQFVYVALDRDTKLVPSWQVGRRTQATTTAFMRDLHSRIRITRRNWIELSTDGFTMYEPAIVETFGRQVHYGQVIKIYSSGNAGRGRYSPPVVSAVRYEIISGYPEQTTTSHCERQNLQIRMQVRRFTRLTNAFSKKLANLEAAVALHFAYYNLCQRHGTIGTTPAVRAGVTDHEWTIEELLNAATAGAN